MGIARSRIVYMVVFAFVVLALAPGTMLYAWAEGHGNGTNKESTASNASTDRNGDVKGDANSNNHTGAKGRGAGGDDKPAASSGTDLNGHGCTDNCGNHFGESKAKGKSEEAEETQVAGGATSGAEVSNAGGGSTGVEISSKETGGVAEREAGGRGESPGGVNVSGSERANVTGPSAAEVSAPSGVTQESTEVKTTGAESSAGTTTAITTPASETTTTTVESTTTTEAAQTTTAAPAAAAPAAPAAAAAPSVPVLGAAQAAAPAQRMVLGAQQMRLPHTGLSEAWAMVLTGGRWMGMLLGALGLLLLARGIRQS